MNHAVLVQKQFNCVLVVAVGEEASQLLMSFVPESAIGIHMDSRCIGFSKGFHELAQVIQNKFVKICGKSFGLIQERKQ